MSDDYLYDMILDCMEEKAGIELSHSDIMTCMICGYKGYPNEFDVVKNRTGENVRVCSNCFKPNCAHCKLCDANFFKSDNHNHEIDRSRGAGQVSDLPKQD